MNSLEIVVLDQHLRVQAAGNNTADVLRESQGEIMSVATPDLMLEIIEDHNRTSPENETRSSRAQMRAFDNPHSITNRSIKEVQNANGLARIDFLVERQGYIGGLLFDGEDIIVHAHSMLFNRLKTDDPIQIVSGELFYPAMVWAKALRAEAYKNRSESAQNLTISEYLSEMGLTLGAMVNEYGDIVGATGFMPGPRLKTLEYDSEFAEHISSEVVEEFRLSGLCDQSVLDPEILTETTWFATGVLAMGGSLN